MNFQPVEKVNVIYTKPIIIPFVTLPLPLPLLSQFRKVPNTQANDTKRIIIQRLPCEGVVFNMNSLVNGILC